MKARQFTPTNSNYDTNEMLQMLVQANNGDQTIRNQLIEQNMPLVHSIVGKLCQDPSIFEDLVQEGCTGLIEAIDRFDPTRGTRLAPFAYHYIYRSVYNAIYWKYQTMKLPEDAQNLIQSYRKEREKCVIDWGYEPTTDQIIEKLNLTPDQKKALYHLLCTYMSTQETVFDDSGDTIEDQIPNLDPDIPSQYEQMEQIEIIQKLFEHCMLSELERKIVILEYGLYGQKALSDVEISKIFNISFQYVQRLGARALKKLRLMKEVGNLAIYTQSPTASMMYVQGCREFYKQSRNNQYKKFPFKK